MVPADLLPQMQQAKVLISNYHAFIRREKLDAAALTKKVLAGPDGDTDRFRETPDEMVRRVLRPLGLVPRGESIAGSRPRHNRRAVRGPIFRLWRAAG